MSIDNLRTEVEGCQSSSGVLRTASAFSLCPRKGAVGRGGQQVGWHSERLGLQVSRSKGKERGLGTSCPLGDGITELCDTGKEERLEEGTHKPELVFLLPESSWWEG